MMNMIFLIAIKGKVSHMMRAGDIIMASKLDYSRWDKIHLSDSDDDTAETPKYIPHVQNASNLVESTSQKGNDVGDCSSDSADMKNMPLHRQVCKYAQAAALRRSGAVFVLCIWWDWYACNAFTDLSNC